METISKTIEGRIVKQNSQEFIIGRFYYQTNFKIHKIYNTTNCWI